MRGPLFPSLTWATDDEVITSAGGPPPAPSGRQRAWRRRAQTIRSQCSVCPLLGRSGQEPRDRSAEKGRVADLSLPMLNQVLEATLAVMILLLALSVAAIVRIGPMAQATTESNTDTEAGAQQPIRAVAAPQPGQRVPSPAACGRQHLPGSAGPACSAAATRRGTCAGGCPSRARPLLPGRRGGRPARLPAGRSRVQSAGPDAPPPRRRPSSGAWRRDWIAISLICGDLVNQGQPLCVLQAEVGGRATLDVRVSQGQIRHIGPRLCRRPIHSFRAGSGDRRCSFPSVPVPAFAAASDPFTPGPLPR